jgi:hypothetical protein
MAVCSSNTILCWDYKGCGLLLQSVVHMDGGHQIYIKDNNYMVQISCLLHLRIKCLVNRLLK